MGKRRLVRLPFGLIGVGILSVILTSTLVWITVVDDPLGGEPVAVLPLDAIVEGVTSQDIEVVEIRPGIIEKAGDSFKYRPIISVVERLRFCEPVPHDLVHVDQAPKAEAEAAPTATDVISFVWCLAANDPVPSFSYSKLAPVPPSAVVLGSKLIAGFGSTSANRRSQARMKPR